MAVTVNAVLCQMMYVQFNLMCWTMMFASALINLYRMVVNKWDEVPKDVVQNEDCEEVVEEIVCCSMDL